MAIGSIFAIERDDEVRAVLTTAPATAERAVTVSIGDMRIRMSREEAAQLAADLLNVAGVTPVDANVAELIKASAHMLDASYPLSPQAEWLRAALANVGAAS